MPTDHALEAYRDTLRRMYERYPLKVMVDEIDREFPGKLDDCVASAMRAFEDSVRWDSAESKDIPAFVVKKQTTTYCMTREEMAEALKDMMEKVERGYYGPLYFREKRIMDEYLRCVGPVCSIQMQDGEKSKDDNP